MRRIYPYIAILLILAACVKVEPAPGPEPVNPDGRDEFVFRAVTDLGDDWVKVQTKGDVTMSDLESGGWGLYGYYTGTSDYVKPASVSGTLFNHRQVRWDSTNSVWDYSIDAQHKKEYWPMDPDDKVSFFAYGPYSLYSSNAYVNNETGPYVSYTASTDLSQQKDLLWATNTSGLPHRNVNQASYASGEVDMHFRHAPAKIHFNINSPSQVDQSTARVLYSDNSNNPEIRYEAYELTTSPQNGTLRYNNGNRNVPAYNAYRNKITIVTKVYHQTINGLKILVDRVEMENFHGQGDLLLNNPDPFVPAWTPGNQTISYTFDGDELNPVIVNPGNDNTLLDGWGTTYLGVDSDTKELLLTPNNYIYMIPKTADAEDEENTKNIRISVYYHLLGYTGSDGLVEITETTTTTQRQTVRYITYNNSTYYLVRDNSSGNDDFVNEAQKANAAWANTSDAPVTPDPVVTVTKPDMHSQDNGGEGFKAIGRIRTSIIGGRNYTINLYLNGSDLDLTVIPQPWDLNEVIYDLNAPLNAIRQPLTYDGNFIYSVFQDKVYINNRMGKFYFKLDRGKYLYWQASLIGDDAFAFTDENGEYLMDENGNYMTSIRGDISGDMNYIYVKAINTSSRVTSKAKLRIYLFDADNHAVVALPQEGWLFINNTYEENGVTKRVQEWSVVQTAN